MPKDRINFRTDKTPGSVRDAHAVPIDPRRQIAIIWSVEDVQEVRPDLSDEQAFEVLHSVKNNHDACEGVNWLVLEIVADILYPSPD
jgi:hypothetical protein